MSTKRLRDFYGEMKERLKYVESLPESEENTIRIEEINLFILRIQQILLEELKPKGHDTNLRQIADPNSYAWIKVKRFNEPTHLPDDPDELRRLYGAFQEHHRLETEFLINTCKELATIILNEP